MNNDQSNQLLSLATIVEVVRPEDRYLALNGLWSALMKSPGPLVDKMDVVLTLDAAGCVQASTTHGKPAWAARVHRGRFSAWLCNTPQGRDLCYRHRELLQAFDPWAEIGDAA